MTVGCLIKVSPLNISTGSRVDLYLSTFGKRADAEVNGLNGQTWIPAVAQPPVVGITLWSGDFGGSIDPGGATIPINLNVLSETYSSVGTYVWIGAPVEIYTGEPGDSWPWTTFFVGRVTNYNGTYPNLTLQCQVDQEPFKANILTDTYAGTGGAEGGDDLKNRVKPSSSAGPRTSSRC